MQHGRRRRIQDMRNEQRQESGRARGANVKSDGYVEERREGQHRLRHGDVLHLVGCGDER
jgi:hypothetical protein